MSAHNGKKLMNLSNFLFSRPCVMHDSLIDVSLQWSGICRPHIPTTTYRRPTQRQTRRDQVRLYMTCLYRRGQSACHFHRTHGTVSFHCLECIPPAIESFGRCISFVSSRLSREKSDSPVEVSRNTVANSSKTSSINRIDSQTVSRNHQTFQSIVCEAYFLRLICLDWADFAVI